MKHTAAEYEKMATEEIAAGNYAAAQVFATLAQAAATKEAQESIERNGIYFEDIHRK